jgi:curved DNA-binding protein CbpA
MDPKTDHASNSDSGLRGALDPTIYPRIVPLQNIIAPPAKSHQGKSNVAPESPTQQALAGSVTPQVNTDDSNSDSFTERKLENEQAIIDYQLMLRKQPDTFYGHLGLQDTAEAKDVTRAYRQWTLKLHPHQNKLKGATEWYAKVQKAYLTLKDKKNRKKYDEEQKLVHFGRDQSPTSESDSESRSGNIPPPTAKVTKALARIADKVAIYLLSDDKEERRLAKEKIREANRKVQAANATSGVKDDAYTFGRKPPELRALAQDFCRVKACLMAGDDLLASEMSRSLIKNFDDFRKRPQNQWPQSWTYAVTAAIAAAHESKGYSFIVLPPKKDLPKVGRPRDYDSDFDSDPAFDSDATEGVAMADVGQLLRQDAHYWAIGPEPLIIQVKPGFTEGGRRILGYRAWYPASLWRKGVKFDPETAKTSTMQFIIQGYGRRILLVPGSSISESVKHAYLDQKPSRKVFVPNRREEIHANIPVPVKIKDYACCHSFGQVVPDGVALCEARDGKEFLISREILRVIKGEADADTFIYLHLLKAGKPMPFYDAQMRQKLGLGLRRARYQKRSNDVSSDSGSYNTRTNDYSGIYDSSSDDYSGRRDKGRSGFGS